jgi:uncharacterized protein YbaP (TraB family)
MKQWAPLAAAAWLSAGLTGPAAAQDQAVDAEDALVEELIVSARRPGPAMWKVADSDTVVWVMGVPNALPKGLEWNRQDLKARLAKANVLIAGTGRWKANVFSLLWMVLTGRDKFAAEGPLSQTLPPDLYARYQKARGRSDLDQRYPTIKPAMAAMAVSMNFQQALGLQSREPERSIRKEAFLRVRVQEVGESDAVDFLRIFRDMPRDTELACMEDALRQVEAGRDRMLEAARGWARGDLRVAVSAERGWERCIAKDPQIARIVEANMSAVTAAIGKALEKPGHAVAIVELRPLLAQNGVLVRLKALEGVTVTAPDAPGLEEDEAATAPAA